MTKKILLTVVVGMFLFTYNVQAQTQNSGSINTPGYQNAVGLGIDFGTGGTGAGIALKHFFSSHGAGEANLLFYNSTVSLGAFYEYHGFIQNAEGLKWYFGLGPQFFFNKGGTTIAARIPIGLDYKIPQVPLNFSFDWRPYYRFNHNSEFIAARFGVGVRFTF